MPFKACGNWLKNLFTVSCRFRVQDAVQEGAAPNWPDLTVDLRRGDDPYVAAFFTLRLKMTSFRSGSRTPPSVRSVDFIESVSSSNFWKTLTAVVLVPSPSTPADCDHQPFASGFQVSLA